MDYDTISNEEKIINLENKDLLGSNKQYKFNYNLKMDNNNKQKEDTIIEEKNKV